MSAKLKKTYERLREIRASKDVSLKLSKYLRHEVTSFDGSLEPLRIRNYQAQAVLHLLSMPRFLLGDDTGLGKTLSCIVAMSLLAELEPSFKVMIVATRSVASQWVEEIQKFCLEEAFEIYVAKTPKTRPKVYEAWANSKGRAILVTRYGIMRNDIHTLKEYEGYTLITDEAAEYSNPEAQINQVMRFYASKSKRMWALTATPIQNNLIEGFGIYNCVVPGLFPKTKRAFVDRYCVTQLQRLPSGRKIPIILGYKKGMVQHFRDSIDPFFLARSKQDVAKELPPVIIVRYGMDMTKAQQSLYLDCLASAEEPDEEGNVQSKFTILVKCQQIANDPRLIEEEGRSSKVAKLFEIISEGELSREKIVVYSRFRTQIDLLEQECEKRKIGCVRITGSESGPQRDEARKKFVTPDNDTRICFITRAGGVGLNLQIAKAIIFFDTPWSAGIYQQLVGRVNRIGSSHNRIFAIHLACHQSIDENVLKTLKKKLDLVTRIVGNRISMEEVAKDLSPAEIDDIFEAEMKRKRNASR